MKYEGLPQKIMRAVGMMVAGSQEMEYSCDDVYQLLDRVAEAIRRGDDVAHLMPLVQQHLDMCPDCREELEALLRTLKAMPA